MRNFNAEYIIVSAKPIIFNERFRMCQIPIADPSSASDAEYLELQKIRPFFNTKSSFFRGNSLLFLHFQQTEMERKTSRHKTLQFEIRWDKLDRREKCEAFVDPDEPFLIQNSSFEMQNSSFLIQNSSIVTVQSSENEHFMCDLD